MSTLPTPPREQSPRRLDDPRHWLWPAIGCGLVALCAWPILWAHVLHPGPRYVTGSKAAYIDSSTGPCPPERWELACRRLVDAGWACMTGPGGVPVHELTLADCPTDSECRGAHDSDRDYRDALAIAPHACGEDDPTAEHEVGHLLGLADCPGCPIGDVMSTPNDRTGLTIPRRLDP